METGRVDHFKFTSSKITGDRDRNRIETELGPIEGIRDVEVDPATHSGDVAFDPLVTDTNKIRQILLDNGYRVDEEPVAAPPEGAQT